MFLFCISHLAIIFNYTYLGSGYVVGDGFYSQYNSGQVTWEKASNIVISKPICSNISFRGRVNNYTTRFMKVGETSDNPYYGVRSINLYPNNF